MTDKKLLYLKNSNEEASYVSLEKEEKVGFRKMSNSTFAYTVGTLLIIVFLSLFIVTLFSLVSLQKQIIVFSNRETRQDETINTLLERSLAVHTSSPFGCQTHMTRRGELFHFWEMRSRRGGGCDTPLEHGMIKIERSGWYFVYASILLINNTKTLPNMYLAKTDRNQQLLERDLMMVENKRTCEIACTLKLYGTIRLERDELLGVFTYTTALQIRLCPDKTYFRLYFIV